MSRPGHEAPSSPFEMPTMTPGPAQGAAGCHFRAAADHGAWIKRQRPSEHYCFRPDLNAGLRDKVVDGDQWQCHDCQAVWTVRRTRSVARPWEFRRADSDNPPDYDG
ncbi:hypothetical protein ACWEF6_02680 [Amycolatopsis sp. NPDC004772]